MNTVFNKDWQYYKFCLYGLLKNQRFFEPFLLLIFLREKGLNFTQIGTLYSIRFILRALFEIPSGFAADALGRKGTMLFSYALYMLSFALYFLSPNFWWLIVPTVSYAIGDAFRTGTHKAMIFEYLKKKGWADQKVAYYGHTRSWSQTGSAISSLLAAGLILLNMNLNLVFLYSLIPYFIGFILLASYPRWLDGTAAQRQHPFKDIWKVMIRSYHALKTKESIRLNLNAASFSGFYQAAKDYLQIILTAAVAGIPFLRKLDKPADEKEIFLIGGGYFVLYFITAAASRSAGKIRSYFADQAKYLNLLLLAGLLVALGAGIFHHFASFVPAIILFTGVLFIQNVRRPACVAAIADSYDSGILATVLSVESQLSSVLGAVFSMIIGFTADQLGFGYAIAICSVLVLLLFPVIRLKPAGKLA